MVQHYSLFTDFDLELFAAGKHYRLYEKFGSHVLEVDGKKGVYFSVYAPAACRVEVIGSWNNWQGHQHALFVKWDGSGIWEGFIPEAKPGQLYKYRIYSNHDTKVREKADPYARYAEQAPKTASIIYNKTYQWTDQSWVSQRAMHNSLDSPMTIYEVHLGSWRKQWGSPYALSYADLATQLVDYVDEMGFTHVEFLPLTEHPFFPSWGYLSTGYFASTSRYGKPEELKQLIDAFHAKGIAVIMDWVPGHFPSDDFALADFDGTHLYEHPDPKKGFHPDWNSLIFNFERPQIVSFLLSSAHYWFNEFHIDGIRVDAVASMVYLDYSRDEGEWEPNIFGGNTYLAAVDFLKELNKSVYHEYVGVQMIAEESTAFPGVTTPVHHDGLGFGYKWMMGWMNDTLEYFSLDPIYRKYHHNDISRSLTYAFTENYVLPLSHDEVVHGKQSLLSKMPGDEWQQFANLRLLYAYMYAHPGQKLLFMGDEIAQRGEWNVNDPIDWNALNGHLHLGVQCCVKDLNAVYRKVECLHAWHHKSEGFEWIDYSDSDNTVIVFKRVYKSDYVLVVLNFSPVVRHDYKIGVDDNCDWIVLFNSDDKRYGGSDLGEINIEAANERMHGRPYTINITLPPLAAMYLKPKIVHD